MSVTNNFTATCSKYKLFYNKMKNMEHSPRRFLHYLMLPTHGYDHFTACSDWLTLVEAKSQVSLCYAAVQVLSSDSDVEEPKNNAK